MNTEATITQDNISVRFSTIQFATISDTVTIQQSAITSDMGGSKTIDWDTDQPIIDYFHENWGHLIANTKEIQVV